MDELLKTVILGAPNVAVALAALWWASKLIERMVAAQERLTGELLEKCAEVSELRQQVAEASSAVKVAQQREAP